MLKLRYLTDEHLAEISSKTEPAWTEIRRVCEERAEDVCNISGHTLTIPWWSFLNCRPAISFIIQKYDLDFKVDETSERLLKEALERKGQYERALGQDIIPKKLLLSRLRKRGFVRSLTREQIRN